MLRMQKIMGNRSAIARCPENDEYIMQILSCEMLIEWLSYQDY